ncbi:hypothetical protein LOTGIDRAFT_236737 [Lottia gigantea]|uniref:Uncharacterized protein n=1 Tax=Lottia gigantea TaxID=225164 RepID=V3ZLK7_LOTGI|nr:hypothetical protein LOTGIDRAFT_236737 [Lottia gigantea]ESO83300.1 hypothetical protein LOTGIDRAFT_236737 [Lottia gigantea]
MHNSCAVNGFSNRHTSAVGLLSHTIFVNCKLIVQMMKLVVVAALASLIAVTSAGYGGMGMLGAGMLMNPMMYGGMMNPMLSMYGMGMMNPYMMGMYGMYPGMYGGFGMGGLGMMAGMTPYGVIGGFGGLGPIGVAGNTANSQTVV